MVAVRDTVEGFSVRISGFPFRNIPYSSRFQTSGIGPTSKHQSTIPLSPTGPTSTTYKSSSNPNPQFHSAPPAPPRAPTLCRSSLLHRAAPRPSLLRSPPPPKSPRCARYTPVPTHRLEVRRCCSFVPNHGRGQRLRAGGRSGWSRPSTSTWAWLVAASTTNPKRLLPAICLHTINRR
jgi:hypothetical protein